MIVFRHVDPRFPFLWESASQPAGRWHGPGEGPVQYFAETPDGAWAEFLRHEGIVDAADLDGVARAVWAVDLPQVPRTRPGLDAATLTGGLSTYGDCQRVAGRMRARGARGLVSVSAAIDPATSGGSRTDHGLRPGSPRAERVFVLFGRRPNLLGWAACSPGRPRDDLLRRVRHLG